MTVSTNRYYVFELDNQGLFTISASDYNTTIYTVATSGTDHVIKIWRIFCLRDLKSPKGSSKLLPNGTQVSNFYQPI